VKTEPINATQLVVVQICLKFLYKLLPWLVLKTDVHVSLKLVVNKETHKVLFAQAGEGLRGRVI